MAINSTIAAEAIPVRPTEFFGELLPGSIFMRPGAARVIEDATGTMPVPRVTLPGVSHVAEGASGTDTDATVTGGTLSPKEVTFTTSYHSVLDELTDSLIIQVYDEIAAAKLLSDIEKQTIQGTGTNNLPLGILHTGSIAQQTGITTAAHYHTAEETFLNQGLSSEQVSVILATDITKSIRALAANDNPLFSNKSLLGYPTVITPQCPTGKGLLIYLPAVVIAFFGQPRRTVDRQSNPGTTKLTYSIYYDAKLANNNAALELST